MSSREQLASSKSGYRRVIAFQRADTMAKAAYKLAQKVAGRDRWLSSQLARAAISAPLNIVEGHSRGTTRDFLRFLETALSSISEVEYLLEFLAAAGLITQADIETVEPHRREAAATLTGLIKALQRKLAADQKDWRRNLISEDSETYGVENAE
ncbi:MAG TPA: four helix bundle protein [Dehalococcoidia bacterium]|nr:four helix bundle protein [Dehalococcoidia bacterium]